MLAVGRDDVAALNEAARATLRHSGHLGMRGLEFGAAGCVFSFGILLLTGYMASERMGLF